MKFMQVFFMVVVASLLAVGHVSAANSVDKYNKDPLTVAVPANMSNDVIQEVIVLTILNRGWTLTNRADNEVTGKIIRPYRDSGVKLRWVDDTIMILVDTAYQKRVGKNVVKVPLRWFKNIQKDLTFNLSLAKIKSLSE